MKHPEKQFRYDNSFYRLIHAIGPWLICQYISIGFVSTSVYIFFNTFTQHPMNSKDKNEENVSLLQIERFISWHHVYVQAYHPRYLCVIAFREISLWLCLHLCLYSLTSKAYIGRKWLNLPRPHRHAHHFPPRTKPLMDCYKLLVRKKTIRDTHIRLCAPFVYWLVVEKGRKDGKL